MGRDNDHWRLFWRGPAPFITDNDGPTKKFGPRQKADNSVTIFLPPVLEDADKLILGRKVFQGKVKWQLKEAKKDDQ